MGSNLDGIERDLDEIKRPYYPFTSYQQRLIAMKVWEKTRSWREACRVSGIGKDTFYLWRPRWLEKGEEGLIDDTSNRAPNNVRKIPEEMERHILEIHREAKKKRKPKGKKAIAQQMAQERADWPIISPNTVRRVLIDHGEWYPTPPLGKAKASTGRSRRRA